MRPINADELMQNIRRHCIIPGWCYPLIELEINDAPTIEAVPVHGEWILDLDEYDVEFAECSVCKEVFYDGENDTFDIHPNFCPNCGAKMKVVRYET